MIADGLSPDDVTTTMLWCSAVVAVLSCGMLILLGLFRLGDLLKFVPQTVRIGLFACIGVRAHAISTTTRFPWVFCERLLCGCSTRSGPVGFSPRAAGLSTSV